MELLLDNFVLSSVTSREVITSLHDEHLESWKNFLNALPHLKKSDDLLIKTLKVIGLKLTEFSNCDEVSNVFTKFREKQIKILSETCSNDKFIEAVKGKIIEWSVKEDKKKDLETVLLLMYSFCEEIIKKIPEFGKDFLYNLVSVVARVVWSSQHVSGVDQSILVGFQKVEKRIQRICEVERVAKEQEQCRGLITDYEKMLHEGRPPDDYREIRIVPSLAEIMGAGKVFLRPNKVIGPYDDGGHYLDVQFRLLREDFVQPLRNTVKEFVKNLAQTGIGRPTNAPSSRDNSVRIYKGVFFNKIEMSKENGKDYLFNLPPDVARSVNWDKSKRLLPGCLVMLSSDNCKTAVFAITLGPPFDSKWKGSGDSRRRELADGVVRLSIETGDDIVKRGVRYIMFESEAYFEAYKHNLKILQQTTFLDGEDQGPMAKFIVSASSSVCPPSYCGKPSSNDWGDWGIDDEKENGTLKLSLSKDEIMSVSVHEPEKWNSAVIQEKIGLNAAQYDAFKMAMTSEIALIQGPPGTGKTFVGLQIVKTLISNKMQVKNSNGEMDKRVFGLVAGNGQNVGDGDGIVPDSPLLILCVTNHALDQFLELLLDRIPYLGVVRVGGQCKSEKLEQYTLTKIRRDVIAKIGGEPVNYSRYKFEEKKAVWWLNKVQERISHVKMEIQEMRNPNGVFYFSEMEVFKKLGGIKKSLRNMWEREQKWLGIEWDIFNPDKFAIEQLIACGFKLNLEWLKRELGGIMKAWTIGDVHKSTAVQVDHQDGEDYDMDELLENRVFDDDVGEVEDKKAEDLEEYRERIYFNNCSVRSCKASAERCGEKVTRRVERAEYENKQQFLSAVLALYKGGYLKLPDLDSRFHAKGIDPGDARYRWAVYFKVIQTAIRCAIELEQDLELDLEKAKERVEKAREKLFYAKEEYLKAMEVLNATILKKCDVVGMTTTGAAKNHSLLQKAGAKIVIVEEAAEILEAHIVTALTGACEHLILIGDHLQLRPSTTVYELGRDYRMNVSLFERLILNGLPYCTLKTQHRMRPEICSLIKGPIYEELLNHESVNLFPQVRGVLKSMFFINHKQFEDNDVDLVSKSNKHEAEFMVGLCSYLLKQGYAKDKITILTMYAGQMFLLKKLMAREFNCRGVRITCVDSFQGEENDIILLSLVRSNEQSSVGFVGINNRVCVALSRARHGLYVIGNMECLTKKGKTWKAINKKLKHAFFIGDGLELFCEKHTRRVVVKNGKDFLKVEGGGCDIPCEKELPCGHKCPLLCHPETEQGHGLVKCKAVCLKKLEGCNHLCGKLCSEECGECMFEVYKNLPCGHRGKVACSKDPVLTRVKCPGFSEKYLSCGHKMKLHCYESTDRVVCNVEVDFEFKMCGHKGKILCSERATARCLQVCNAELPCGHKCLRICHLQDDPTHLLYKCHKLCERLCKYGHPSIQVHECHETCPPCTAPVKKELPCGHPQMVECGVNAEDHKCTFKVRECGKKCSKGHLCDSGHACSGKCPPCQVKVRTKLHCQHKEAMIPCHLVDTGEYSCKEKVKKLLSCGHNSFVECHLPEDLIHCYEMVNGVCVYCNFKGPVKCGYKFQRQACQPCLNKGMTDLPSDPRSGAKRKRGDDVGREQVKKREGETSRGSSSRKGVVLDVITLD